MNRRTFLRLGLLTAIAATSGVVYKSTEAVGVDRWLRWMARGYVARFLGSSPRVALYQVASYDADIASVLQKGWDDAQMPDVRAARVVVKPNLVDYDKDRPAYTHPRVVQALIETLRDRGAKEIIVAEGASFRRDPDPILRVTGFTEMLQKQGLSFVDLNYDDLASIPTKGGYSGLKELLLPRTICDADLVLSVPKLKTHHWTVLSASIKNLFGVVPGIKYGWPKNTLHIRGIPASLAELVDSFPTRVGAVVDGIVGMEGDGPIFGTPVPSGVLAIGSQLVAVDATCARLVGQDPSRISYLSFAAWAGLGPIESDKIAVSGVALSDLTRVFALPPILQ